jgi:predicted dehydrogenase
MCAQHQRFRTESILLKSKIDMGELGKVYATRVEAMATRGIPKQVNNSYTDVKNSGGGPLMDQGAHGLDIAWWFMGCPDPISAFAVTSDKAAPQKNSTMGGVNWDIYNVEDFATGIVRFTDDRSISIQTSYFSHCSEDKFECEVFGTRGGIIWPRLIFTESQSDTIRRKKILVHELEQASVAEMKHFVSLIDGNSEPIVPVSESVKLISIIEGLYRSAETGNMVKF